MSRIIDMSGVDVDQLMVKWEEALALRHARSRLKPLQRTFKRWLIDPVLFITVSISILVLPQSVLSFVTKRRWLAAIKKLIFRALDFLVAGSGLLLTSPLWLAVAVLIKADSKGPIFYRQMRTGVDRRKGGDRRSVSLGHGLDRRKDDRRGINLHGKPFFIYKFRTMVLDAEKSSGAVWATQNDPRITSVGKWLRTFHVDEIPQLLNVLRGEMSMIGPRPERPEIIDSLLRDMPEYHSRLVAKPGITGPAQIFLGYDSCMADIKRKIQFDSLYISHKSVRFYILLLALTGVKILSGLIKVPVGMFNLNIELDKSVETKEFTYSH